MTRTLRNAASLLLLAALAPAWSAAQDRDFKPRVVAPLDRFRPITEFPVLTAEDAKLDDRELVLGVEIKGQARAYPINMLTGPSREILNDELAGVAIAATW